MHAPEAFALNNSCLALVFVIIQASSLQEDKIRRTSEVLADVGQPSFVFYRHGVVCYDA